MTYHTKENERLDKLAWMYYGNPYFYEPILRANPVLMPVGTVPSTLVPAGIDIEIPIIVEPPSINDVSPSWAMDV